MPSDQWTFVSQDDSLEPLGADECVEQQAMHVVEDPWPDHEVDKLANRATERDPEWHEDNQEDLTRMLRQQHYLP
jgi:hypothetical protein